MREVLANVKQVAQPAQHLNTDGDCFACAFAAVLNHLVPERAMDVEEAYKVFNSITKYANSDRYTCDNSHGGMLKALHHARFVLDYPIAHRTHILTPRFSHLNDHFSYGWYGFEPWGDFTEHLEAFVSAGWIAIASMLYDGRGQMVERPGEPWPAIRATDHFVVLDGTRELWEESESGDSSSLNHYVHVVCSTGKGAYWIDTRHLLRGHGVAGLILVRRNER